MMHTFKAQQPNLLGTKAFIAGLGLVFASVAFAGTTSPTYHYLPADELKSSIQSSLTEQQLDISAVDIKVDDSGAVSAEGDVASKEAAESIAKVLQEKEGVYSVYTRLVYAPN